MAYLLNNDQDKAWKSIVESAGGQFVVDLSKPFTPKDLAGVTHGLCENSLFKTKSSTSSWVGPILKSGVMFLDVNYWRNYIYTAGKEPTDVWDLVKKHVVS